MLRVILFSFFLSLSYFSFTQTDISIYLKNASDKNYFNKQTRLLRNENDSSYFIELIFVVKFLNNKIDSVYNIYSNDVSKKNENNIIKILKESEEKWNMTNVNNKIIVFHFSIYSYGIDGYYNENITAPFFDLGKQRDKIIKLFPDCTFLETIKIEDRFTCILKREPQSIIINNK